MQPQPVLGRYNAFCIFPVCYVLILLSQPLMSLLFGNLTQQFVNFSIVNGRARAGDPAAIAEVPTAAAAFRASASESASKLVYIGTFFITICPGVKSHSRLCIYRTRDTRLHVHLHEYLGSHFRGKREAPSRKIPPGGATTRRSIFR